MPSSPFPGMDPYVEMQEWDDFHPNSGIGMMPESAGVGTAVLAAPEE